MSVYVKLCNKCRKAASLRVNGGSSRGRARGKDGRERKSCADCRYIAVAPASSGGGKRRSLGTFHTKKEADDAEREAIVNASHGVDLAPARVTVATLMASYIGNRESLGRGAKTLEEYRHLSDHYIVPHLGGLTIAKLRPAHVTGWITKLPVSGGRKGRAISKKTARHAFALLSGALRWGVRQEIAARNVCESAEAPKPEQSTAKAFTADEVTRLLAAARGTRWEHFVTLALTLGARRGELLALSWKDMNAAGDTVTIGKSLSQTKAQVALKETKTGRSRMVPLSLTARDALRKQRVLQAADKLSKGPLYAQDPAEPIFTDELGKRLTPKAATNGFARIAEKAGISTTSLHATRHTAATTLIGAGVDVRTAASILGHVNANVTLAIYSHVIEGAERAALDVLGDRIGRASGERTER